MNPSDSSEPLAASVLVVDDERVVRDVFTRLLAHEHGVAVTTAESAEAGLELLSERRFDLLITDKNLPGMGGVELIARARYLLPSLEAIMITGYASSESVIAAMAAGACDYLVKPFPDLARVRAKIRAALARHDEGLRRREQAREISVRAHHVLQKGSDAPERNWRALDLALRDYEEVGEAEGTVLIAGRELLRLQLEEAGVAVTAVDGATPVRTLEACDALVVDTEHVDWRSLAKRLKGKGPDLIAVANDSTDLADLLDAVSIGVELVGFGGPFPPKVLPERVRAVLLRRSIERAQAALTEALGEFERSLKAA